MPAHGIGARTVAATFAVTILGRVPWHAGSTLFESAEEPARLLREAALRKGLDELLEGPAGVADLPHPEIDPAQEEQRLGFDSAAFVRTQQVAEATDRGARLIATEVELCDVQLVPCEERQ